MTTNDSLTSLSNRIKVKLSNFKPKYSRGPKLIVFNYDMMSHLTAINEEVSRIKVDLAIMDAINYAFSPRVRPDDFEVY